MTEVNPTLKNPRYAGALRLGDLQPGARFVTLRGGDRRIEVVELAAKWFTTADHKILVSTVGFEVINLVDYGIHPHPLTKDWRGSLSVEIDGDKIRKFHEWLHERYLLEAAIQLKGLLPELFATESEWRELIEQS